MLPRLKSTASGMQPSRNVRLEDASCSRTLTSDTWSTGNCGLCVASVREEIKLQSKKYEKTEDDLKALQGVGQLIGEVLRQLDSEKCEAFDSAFV